MKTRVMLSIMLNFSSKAGSLCFKNVMLVNKTCNSIYNYKLRTEQLGLKTLKARSTLGVTLTIVKLNNN